MTKELKKYIFEIFKQTISNCKCPTALDIPIDQGFTTIRSFSTELCYEKEYDMETNETKWVLAYYNSSNTKFEEALCPFIEKSEDPRHAWMECATLLFKFLKNRALEAIDNNDDMLAIGYIESLDFQAHCIDLVANNNKMRTNTTLIELNKQLEDILNLYQYNDEEEYEN